MFLPCKSSTMVQMQEEEEVVIEFGSNYSNNYYVQSPSTMSHANSTTTDTQEHHQSINTHHLPLHEEDESYSYPTKPLLLCSNLSRCSSSRASTTAFIHHTHDKMMTLLPSARPVDVLCTKKMKVVSDAGAVTGLRKLDDEDDDEYEYDEGKSSCWMYFSFNTYPSSVWFGLQLLWRFFLSVLIALLVFYLATKPPPPHLSLKVTRVNQFELTEGVDLTGVATNFLSCNVSMSLIIDNRSKVFGVNIQPPFVDIYFGRVPFVLSQGSESYVRSREWREMEVFGGTKKKAMYGGGRNMEDMLNSDQGLPLLITLTFNSYFQVVPKFIHSEFHHRAHCLLLLHNLYDKKHHTQAYNSTCFLTS